MKQNLDKFDIALLIAVGVACFLIGIVVDIMYFNPSINKAREEYPKLCNDFCGDYIELNYGKRPPSALEYMNMKFNNSDYDDINIDFGDLDEVIGKKDYDIR